MKYRTLPIAAVLTLLLAIPVTSSAACVLQLSETGTVALASGERRVLSWNEVPGATSFIVVKIAEESGGTTTDPFNDPFGSAYRAARGQEVGPNTRAVAVEHRILFLKTPIRYSVTAISETDPSFQPCTASVRYVVAPDEKLSSIAGRIFIPLAGKTSGMNGSGYRTSLLLRGSSNLPSAGRIVFRPLGEAESENDPSIPYEVDGGATLLIEDVMAMLGASGVGAIEIDHGFAPPPEVDAVVTYIDPAGERQSTRVPGIAGRDLLERPHNEPELLMDVEPLPPDTVVRRMKTVKAVLQDPAKFRLAIGMRVFGEGGPQRIALLSSTGELKAQYPGYREVIVGGETMSVPDPAFPHPAQMVDGTLLFSLAYLFGDKVATGDQVVLEHASDEALVFFTETNNETNAPLVFLKKAEGTHNDDDIIR